MLCIQVFLGSIPGISRKNWEWILFWDWLLENFASLKKTILSKIVEQLINILISLSIFLDVFHISSWWDSLFKFWLYSGHIVKKGCYIVVQTRFYIVFVVSSSPSLACIVHLLLSSLAYVDQHTPVTPHALQTELYVYLLINTISTQYSLASESEVTWTGKTANCPD